MRIRNPKVQKSLLEKAVAIPKPEFEKIVITSDWHGHLYHKEALNHLLENHTDADILVIGGDFFDGHSISSYVKNDRVGLMDEYLACQEVLSKLCEAFKKVVLFGGNHDFRWERQIVSQVPIEARAFIGEPLLKRLARRDFYEDGVWHQGEGYPNLELVLTEDHQVSWWWGYKSILCTHSERFLKGAGVIAERTEEFFRRKLGLDPKVIVCAHTHRLNIRYTPSCIYVEGGCMCEESDYAKMQPSLKYSEQRVGYTVVTLKDGKPVPSKTYLQAIEDVR